MSHRSTGIFGGLVIAQVHHAAKQHFSAVHNELDQPDVLNVQIQFFRLLFPSKATVHFKDTHLGKSGSTLHFTVSQNGKDCIVGMINLQVTAGVSFRTSWTLMPAPIPASVVKLSQDADPNWISYQCPYIPTSFRRIQSYIKFFVPYTLQDRSFLDQWMTPSDSSAMFTNDDIGFVTDISFPILDNFFPGNCTGSHANTVSVALQQKHDRENGTVRYIESGSYESQGMVISLATNIEIKKRLPAEGVKWLFMRAQAKEIKHGRQSMEIILLDAEGDLVALSSQILPIITLERQKRDKQKI
ncbi:MAG: hypothetical protein M1821_005717 [Bathelium mastoideum]|nr:MAG: hypothetical protein M1821_005717 [Bathelium mastoideum]